MYPVGIPLSSFAAAGNAPTAAAEYRAAFKLVIYMSVNEVMKQQ